MISIYFGSPGCGKSTVACKLIKKLSKKKKYKYFITSFFTQRLNNVHYISNLSSVLGKYTPPEYTLVVDDEIGITYNNRQYKSMLLSSIEWFKLHRHYKVDYIGMSQAFDDMDIVIRRLADEYWYVKKLGVFTLCRRVYKYCTVEDSTHQIIDGYRMASGFSLFTSLLSFVFRPFPVLRDIFRQQWTLTFRPFYYKYFDSFTHPDTPIIPLKSN